jgi:hypothetical protein
MHSAGFLFCFYVLAALIPAQGQFRKNNDIIDQFGGILNENLHFSQIGGFVPPLRMKIDTRQGNGFMICHFSILGIGFVEKENRPVHKSKATDNFTNSFL